MIPSWAVQQFLGEKPIEVLELTAFVAPGEHTSVLYEDDGVTPGGPHRVSRFVLSEQGLARTLVEGVFEPRAKRVRVRVVGREHPVTELEAPGEFSLPF